MKKFKQCMALVLAAAMLLLLLASCANQPAQTDQNQTTTDNTTNTQPDTSEDTQEDQTQADSETDLSSLKVGFAQDTLNQPWRSYQADCVVSEFAKYGITCSVTDGQGSSETQIANIEDMVANGLDLLVVSPAQEAALTSAVSEAYNAGIPVVCIDRGIVSEDFSCYVHADNYAIGGMVADWLAEKLTEKNGEPKGTVVVLEGLAGATTTVQRGTGFTERLEEAYPDIEILASQPADFNRATAMTIMEDFLQAYDQIDAVFTHADESTMGAILAIENAGRRDEMLICSVNGTTEGIKAILDGRMDMTVMYTNASGPGVEMAIKILQGEDVPKNITIDPLVIDASNAEEYYFEDTYSPDPIPLEESTYTQSDTYVVEG